MSLARLWQQQGKQSEARQILTEIYNWFTEGFATADLQEAKALLTTLAGRETKRRNEEKDARRKTSSSRDISPKTEKSRSK